ncbi:transglutaminase TgpA family protein [Imhoffiella purpurea]|uniref:Transglutaminase-like enzyme n=1 Tax=Imhoffiella purpurea TaxID=1249627 RepID=W9VAT3_9GAMM|nr:DUF3488 and transglutaminase-like domain-containing protein [Imhoffiella purpurea]EXJ14036.1 Transglutaminase-like enzyme [Imhoffiella purpurea]
MAKTKTIPPHERPEQGQVLWTSLLVIAAGLPLTSYLDWQIRVFLGLVIAVRLASLRWPAALPGGALRALLTVAGVANCLHANHTLVGQDGGTALLTTMLALKLLELKTRRDLRLTLILIGFLIVAQFLFDQAFGLAVYLALVALGLVALLIDLNGGLEDRRLRSAIAVGARLSLQAVPLTLVLFLLFPRLTAPLWNLGLDDSERGRMGMSDTMEPGRISELVINGELAFRVRFDGQPPASDARYWRGPVLWAMDGRRWSPGNPPANTTKQDPLLESGETLDYEVLLEETNQKWLFALDVPVSAPENAFIADDLQLVSRERINGIKRYRVRSALDYRTAMPGAARRDYGLQLPPNITQRMRDLVADWRARSNGDWDLVRHGLDYLNREEFHYTLQPPALGANPADEFLFETRRGFCEHYASAFALLMRIAGIPSRIVLGYLGGEQNRFGDYWAVWQSDAHAWVEVLIDGRGWVRVDPTSAIDPSRVDNRGATRLLGAASSIRFDLHEADRLARLVKGLRLFADSLDAAWQNWVLDFSLEDQYALLDRFGLADLGEYGIAGLMILAASLSLGLVMLAMLRGERRLDPLDAQYQRFCQRLSRAGLPRSPHEGPSDYGRRVAHQRPDLAASVGRFLALYIKARFGRTEQKTAADRLRRLLRGFRPKPRH